MTVISGRNTVKRIHNCVEQGVYTYVLKAEGVSAGESEKPIAERGEFSSFIL